MPTGLLAPAPWTVFDDDGVIVPGALIHTYLTGSDDEYPVYVDSGLITEHPNPVECDAAGRAVMYLYPDVAYRFVIADADDNTLYEIDPVMNISVVDDGGSGGAGDVFNFGGDSDTPITATSYPSGATFDKCHSGTSWVVVDSADLPSGVYKLQGMLLGIGGIIVSVALFNLTDSADVAIATITSVSTAGELVASSDITFPAGGADKTYGIKVKVSSGAGLAWGIKIIRE